MQVDLSSSLVHSIPVSLYVFFNKEQHRFTEPNDHATSLGNSSSPRTGKDVGSRFHPRVYQALMEIRTEKKEGQLDTPTLYFKKRTTGRKE